MAAKYLMKTRKSENFTACRECPHNDEINKTINDIEQISKSIDLLNRINRLILKHEDENRLIHETCNTIVEGDLYNFSAIFYFDENENKIFLAATSDYSFSNEAFLKFLTEEQELLKSIRQNKSFLITNQNHNFNNLIKNTSTQSNIALILCLPLKDNSENAFGILVITNGSNDKFIEEEITVLEDLAQDLSVAINRIRIKEQHKEMLKDLELTESRFKLLSEFSTDIVSVLATDGTILYTSPAVEKILGYRPNEIIETSSYNLIHPQDVNKVRRVFQYTITKNAEGKVRFRSKKKNGDYVWIESSGRAVKTDNEVHIFTTSRDITDRVKSEHRIIENERRLSLALQATKTGLWDWDLQNNKLFYSKNYLELLGFNEEDKIVEEDFWRINTHHEDLPMLESLIEYHLVSKSPEFEFEYRKIKKNGEIIWILDKGAVVEWNEYGEPVRMTGTITDITKRKIAEENLRLSEEKYRLIVENSHDGIEISQDDKFIYWNKQFAEMLGYTYDEMKNITFKDIYTPEAINDLNLRHQKRLRGEHLPKQYETTLKKKDGNIIHVQINYEIIEFNGKPATFGTIKDITLNKKAQLELKSSEQFLQKSLDSLSSNIAVLDEKGNIIAVNKRWKEFGIQNGLAEENFCVGINYIQLCESAKGDYAEDGIFVASEIKSLLRGEKSEFHFEYPCHSPKEKRWFVAHFTSFEHNGKPRVIVAHENITERKIAEQKIIEAKEKAEEASRLKSNFLLNMSHELRTPLVGILGFAEILLSEIENEDHRNMVETIFTSGQRLLETLSLILNLSKVESGHEEINLSDFDVNALCLEVANLFSASAAKKNLSINLDFRLKELFIKSDLRLVRDIVNNLVNNAIKFTNEGKITISTYIANYKDKNYIAIEVSDTGIGIPEEKINLIFEEFRQVSEGMNRSFEGTGLGLALTKKIVNLLGGEITVESKVGLGSKFKVYLPTEYQMYTLSFDKKSTVIPEKTETKLEVFPDKKILVVEDDWVSRKFVEVVLKDLCVIEFATTSVEALEKVNSKYYDAILMDINLGRGMDGIATTQMIRNIPEYKLTPIAAITAFATQEDKEEFLAKGCTHYLSKPYTKLALLKLVEDMLFVRK